MESTRKLRSVNGDEWWFRIGFRKFPVSRETNPRLVGGDWSHGATFFTVKDSLIGRGLIIFLNGVF